MLTAHRRVLRSERPTYTEELTYTITHTHTHTNRQSMCEQQTQKRWGRLTNINLRENNHVTHDALQTLATQREQ